jgi:hypothetical protein
MAFNEDISNVAMKTKFDYLVMYALAYRMLVHESC